MLRPGASKKRRITTIEYGVGKKELTKKKK